MKRLLQLVLLLTLLAWCVPAQATITYVGAGALAAHINADISPALPAGTLADDILLVHCYTRDTGDTTTVSGYAEIAQVDTTNASHRWFWKRHSGSEADPTCDHSASANHYGRTYAFRGVVTTGDPWNALGTPEADAGPASYTITALTTGAANSMVVVFSGYEDNDSASVIMTGTDPAAYTEVYAEVVTGADGSISIGYAIRTAAGSTGTITVDYSANQTDDAGSLVLSLDPAPPPPPPPGPITLSGSVREECIPSTETVMSFLFFAVTNGDAILVSVHQRNEQQAVVVSGGGLTWTQIANIDQAQGFIGVELWRATATSTTTFTLSVSITSNNQAAYAIAQAFSGVDTATDDGVEAVATTVGSASDDANMLFPVTTLTAKAWAVAVGSTLSATLTIPGEEYDILSNTNDACTTFKGHMWVEGVATPAETTLGAAGDISPANDWCMIVVSVKPEAEGGGAAQPPTQMMMGVGD